MTVVVIAGSRRRAPTTKLTTLLKEYGPDYVVHGGQPGTDACVAEAIANLPGLKVREVVVQLDLTYNTPKAAHAAAIHSVASGLESVNGDDVICFFFKHTQDTHARKIAAKCQEAGWTIEVVNEEDN